MRHEHEARSGETDTQSRPGVHVRHGHRAVLLCAALGVLGGCDAILSPAEQQYEYVVPVETDDGWRTAALAEKGMDPDPLVQLMNRLYQTDDHLIHSILVVKDSTLVFEAYFDGGDVDLFDDSLLINGTWQLQDTHFTNDVLHHTGSVTKSVVAQAFGIGVDRGRIAGTDATMFSFFPDYEHLRTAAKDLVTVFHLLTMTAGMAWDETTYPIADPRNDAHQLFVTDDPIGFALGKDVVAAPGVGYQYSSGNVQVLGEILRRSTGQSVPSFAEANLFTPLGITSYRWAPCRGDSDVSHAAGGLYLRPRDMAKLGQLMLQGGEWNGERVLSSEWVQRSVASAVAVTDGSFAYAHGFQWKLARFGGIEAYYAFGWGSQFIVVLPELNMVIVQTGGRYSGEPIPFSMADILEDYVIPAVAVE